MQKVDRSVPQGGNEPSVLDADAMRRWYIGALTALRRHRRAVNDLNVFPVPDGDTGTNLVTTLSAGRVECDPGAEVPQLTRAVARGALLAARGNSGVILAQLLQGLADTWTDESVDAVQLAHGLERAAQAAAEAVAEPAKGTILTVAAAAAAAAARRLEADGGAALGEVAVAAADAAEHAVFDTIEQLPALTRAGVVDAGGVGFAVMLDELATVVTGRPSARVDRLLARGPARPGAVKKVPRESGSAEYEYEVQYLVDTDADAVGVLRGKLSRLGDSVVVVGSAGDAEDERTWNVHVHVNDVGAAVEAGIAAGRLHRLSVTRFDDLPRVEQTRRATIVMTASDALTAVFDSENAWTLCGPEITAQGLASDLRATGARELMVLTEAVHRDVAEAAADRLRTEGSRVQVVPIQAPVQALAALAVRDDDRRFDDDAIAMAEAAGSCRHAEVLMAEAAALTTVGRCEAGDYLALVDGDVVLVDARPSSVVCDLADRLCAAGAELLTLVVGTALGDPVKARLSEHLASAWPLVDTQWLTADRGGHLLWIGAE